MKAAVFRAFGDMKPMLRHLLQWKNGSGRMQLLPPFKHDGGYSWIAVAPPGFVLGAKERAAAPQTCLYEDGVRLLRGHAPHNVIRSWGKGLYAHTGRKIWFAASDNSDPNTNGRRYEIDATLDADTWRRAFLQSMTELWDLHPDAEFLKAQGGSEIPPPVFASLGLTNKCNLRCEICGSQKHLDLTGTLRRHMDIGRFEAVANTLFPVLAEVELNSQGDPLLYPHIERVLHLIEQHRCDFKVQTNGTLFTDRVVDLLVRQCGTIMLSLDAVGPRFDEVRRGGVWAKAEGGLTQLLRRRDPARQSIGVYPTLTCRTLGDALDVAKWAVDHDIDEIAFHRYIPILNSFEEAPGSEHLRRLADQLRNWSAAHNSPVTITLDGEVTWHTRGSRRTAYADPTKHRFASLVTAMMAPMDESYGTADPASICVAPDHTIEIGLEGQVATCCRAQDVNLGFATSTEAFARAWFGNSYRRIRASLHRETSGAFPLPNCESCIAAYAPSALRGRRALDYTTDIREGLDYTDWDELPIEVIQKEHGHCHIAMMPPGVALSEYRLFEDALPLGPLCNVHEDIRRSGSGRYSLWDRAVYFSASDNSDARYNGRQYTLRRTND